MAGAGGAANRPALPLPPTPLIGREQVITAVCARLLASDVRLLTLTGPPGIGKTRLALAVADRAAAAFPHGACLVDLAPLSDPALVLSTIARALGVQERLLESLADTVTSFLQDKQVLLVLDNCEHLLPAAPAVAGLLAACAGLRVLATSRVALHLRWEHQVLVQPLALPDLRRLPELLDLAHIPAVALFVERARVPARISWTVG